MLRRWQEKGVSLEGVAWGLPGSDSEVPLPLVLLVPLVGLNSKVEEGHGFPTCMVIFFLVTGRQLRLSSPQQPVQRCKGTQDGLKMYSTTSGNSPATSTSFSIAWQ